MCKDVEAFILAMRARSLECTPARQERWGMLTELTPPGGGKLGVYELRHARPKPARVIARRAQIRQRPRKGRKEGRAAPRSRRGRK
jgi:hypothetical protein